MDTLDQLVSKLNQNPHLIESIARLVDRACSGARDAESGQWLPYRQREDELLRAVRDVSCAAQEHALQGYDDGPQAPEYLLHNGQRFERTCRSSKTYVGLDGPIRLTRWLYKCPQTGQKLCPLELRAGLVESTSTPAAARLEMMSAASDDYRKACELNRAAYVLKRPKSSLQRDVEALGKTLQDHQDDLEKARRQALKEVEDVASISVSVDRTGLPFEEPKKRPVGRPKAGAPKNPCEVVKRQGYCASISLHDAKGHKLMTQRFAALPGQGEQLVEQARACFKELMQTYSQAKVVELCDGAAEMQRRTREILGGHVSDMVLVDAWHAASYVSQAFTAAGYSEDDCKEMVRRLLENKTGTKEMLTRLRTLQIEGSLEAVDEAERYLSNQQERMCYARARELGLPIGSGCVEATCKCVVAVRFKRSGARWKPPGASPLLQVRAWLTSDQDVWWKICDAFLDTYVRPVAA